MLRSLSLDALALPVALLVYGLLMAWTALPAQSTPPASPSPAPAPSRPEPEPPPIKGLDTLLMTSWYGEDHRGRPTDSGERFKPDDLTCAHRLLPFGTRLRLTLGDRTVVVRVNDRGPFHADARGSYDRDLDISQAAAERLGFTVAGLALLEVEPVVAPVVEVAP